MKGALGVSVSAAAGLRAAMPAAAPVAVPVGGVVAAIDAAHVRACQAEHELLSLAVEVDRQGLWEADGARNTAHWMSMRYGISCWKAHRYLAAGYALEGLPLLSAAHSSGRLSTDKVLELSRFATPSTEERLIPWAQKVLPCTVRDKADLWVRAKAREVKGAEKARRLNWWFADSRMYLDGEFPASQGACISAALSRLVPLIPTMPSEEGPSGAEARRADALVMLALLGADATPGEAGGARDTKKNGAKKDGAKADGRTPEKATVVIHADLSGLLADTGGSKVQGGAVVYPQSVKRILCNARTQTVVEDAAGQVAMVGKLGRAPAPWMVRQVRYRDSGCVFPGCGTTRFTEAHHIRFWSQGGKTELSNLALVCWFHHRLVHEWGWHMSRADDGQIIWRRPGGKLFAQGPRPGPKKSGQRALSDSLPAP